MSLTTTQCNNAKPEAKDYSKPDGNGLFLMIRSTGGKTWLCDFVKNGTRHKFSLGSFPDLSLANARILHNFAREMATQGLKPSELLNSDDTRRILLDGGSLKDIQKAKDEAAKNKQAAIIEAERASRMTFGQAAKRFKTEWVDRTWKNPDKGYSPVRVNLLPKLADMALDDITAPFLREWLYEVRERRGEQAALHAHGWAGRIFTYALEHEWCKTNPAQAIKSARIGKKGKRERWLQTQEIRRYLACLYQVDCYRGYKLALHLLLILGLRKNEVCGANWKEIDLATGEWLIPAARMKSAKTHCVFLPTQAIELFKELQRLSGGSEWVMPMPTNPKRAMNGNNLDGAHHAALIAAGIDDYVIHDHRHTASTQLREQGHPFEVVETALSHAIPGTAGTYSHAEYKEQRLTMLQAWADFLDKTMNEQVVIAATFRKIV